MAHDEVRDAVLRREGFRVMRYWAGQIHNEIDDVMDGIVIALEERAPPVSRFARSTLPMKGKEK